MRFSISFLFCLIWAFSPSLFAQDHPSELPLFQSDDMLELTLRTDLKALLKDRDEQAYHDVEWTIHPGKEDSLVVPARAKTRGNFRRMNCKLPPLRINFAEEEVEGTLFEGINKVKLVLPCQWKSENYESYVLEEFLIYRMYNQLTDSSFQVRLLRVHFEDTKGKLKPFDQYCFFIEPTKELGKRLGHEELEVENVHPSETLTPLTNLATMFCYMVGNTDWSIPGLHNVKLYGPTSGTPPLVIPYDFDWCGLISAPYAQPNASLGIQSVTERIYRGFCRPKAEMEVVYAAFLDKKDAFYGLFQEMEGIPEKRKKKITKYLDSFYEVLADEKRRTYLFEEKCRN